MRQGGRHTAHMAERGTRERLLDAAWQEAVEVGPEALTLRDVAARAGLSRQTVYLHFGNRSTLLVEMARRIDTTSGFRAKLAAARALPPREAFLRVLADWLDYVPVILPVQRALEAAALVGGEGADAYRDRMAEWRSALRGDIERLAEEGLLCAAWSVDEAADWVWAHTHPTTVHHLVDERGWSHEQVTRRLLEAVPRQVLAPDEESAEARDLP